MKKKLLSLLLSIAMITGMFSGLTVTASADDTVAAKKTEVSAKDTFWDAVKSANDGDVIEVTSDITIGNFNRTQIKSNCVVTVDLNGHRLTCSGGGDNFGVGSNSVLVIQNGSMDFLDTISSSTGIIILNNLTVNGDNNGDCNTWLGTTTT